MIIASNDLRNKYQSMWPTIFYPVGTLDRKYIIPSINEHLKCHEQCDVYKSMIFSPEIEDCDDFALQYYSQFKLNWARWTKDDVFADTSIGIVRKFHYPVAIALVSGIRFRFVDESHTVACCLREDGFIIFDSLNKDLYKADPKQDIIIKVEMP